MRRVVVSAVAAIGLALAAPAGAMSPPTTIVKACSPVHAGGRTVSVDVISGRTSCTAARMQISAYRASRPAVGKARQLSVNAVKLTCRTFAAHSGFAWHYVCQSASFAATGGGRLLPAANYRKL